MSKGTRIFVLLAIAALLGLALFLQTGRRPALDHTPAHVVVAESFQRRGFGVGVRRLLNLRRFEALEAMAETLRVGGYDYASGYPQSDVFFEGFETVDDPGSADLWIRHLARLREWVDARPGSMTARIALAEALNGRAWAARGNGWAVGVSSDQWHRFADDQEEAGQILDQCPPEVRADPNWYRLKLIVLHSQGIERDSSYRDLLEQATRTFPAYQRLYLNAAVHLMPRWYGTPGDWEKFAARCSPPAPESLADEIYARIVTSQSRFVENVFTASESLSWERVSKGLEDWRLRHPQSLQPRSALALLAWESNHRDEAHRAFVALGDTVELDIWQNPTRFDLARAWAGRDSP